MRSRTILVCSPLQLLREVAAVICIGMIAPGTAVWASDIQTTSTAAPQAPAAEPAVVKLPPDQLDSLVAPIALYPDPMLSQTLIASTYPLEVIQLKQWLDQNKNLSGKPLADAVEKQDWDPSIQSLAGLPEVVKLLSENIKWTTDLGNAFLAQQDDVMAAVQRMRKKAQDSGNLKSSEQQKVEVKTVESKQVIVIEQANPRSSTFPATTRPSCMALRPTRIHRSPILRLATTPRAWRSRSALASRWEPSGAEAVGAVIAVGVAATTTSTSTTTIISFATQTPTSTGRT